MKSKTRKSRDRAKRLGLNDPTLTSGISRNLINDFYKRGTRGATKFDKIARQDRRDKMQLKRSY